MDMLYGMQLQSRLHCTPPQIRTRDGHARFAAAKHRQYTLDDEDDDGLEGGSCQFPLHASAGLIAPEVLMCEQM